MFVGDRCDLSPGPGPPGAVPHLVPTRGSERGRRKCGAVSELRKLDFVVLNWINKTEAWYWGRAGEGGVWRPFS